MPPEPVAGHADDLIDRFIGGHSNERTRSAYAVDLAAFAAFAGQPAPRAVSDLLGGGPAPARELLLRYILDLRRQGLAPATVDRRVSTLRALARSALEGGLVEWRLELPSEREIEAAAMAGAGRADSEHYLLPRHPSEIDRLDVQHYTIAAVQGANYLAPVPVPSRVLDVGAGSGQWGLDLSKQFPDAAVVGFDLVPGKPERPPRYRVVRGNLLQGLPFRDDRFDFVHQRLLVSGIPLAAWPGAVAELVRVARPGGWIELVEGPLRVSGGGPATDRLGQVMGQLSASLGLDAEGVVFESLDGYLRAAGVEDVTRHDLSIPIGPWGGEVGSLAASDFRSGATRVCEVLQARSMLSAEEARALIDDAQDEMDHHRMSWPYAVATGRKPTEARA